MSTPYRHIGVASTFSPRFLAILAEADRVSRRLDAPLSVIHADEEDAARRERFAKAWKRLGRDGEPPVLWSTAPAPTDAILNACAEHGVDLLLAGALERETEHRYFLGGVARGLLQRAACDLFLLTKPEAEEREMRRVVIGVDACAPDIEMLSRACALASRLGAERATFIAMITPFDEAKASTSGGAPLDEAALEEALDGVTGFDGEADFQIIRSNTGFPVCDFVRDCGADLLMVLAGGEGGVRTLPRHMDWLLQVIPTNMLILGGA